MSSLTYPTSPKRYFVTGIGTDVGKTVAAAILTEALQADYWKPVQAGNLEDSDSITVKSLISNERTVFHPEAYRLQMPASPHLAAASEGVRISLDEIHLPHTLNNLIVEGAGGIMVPLNEKDLVLDLIQKFGLEVILVSRNYLGSINHTLTTIAVLQSRNIPISGIMFNGEPLASTEEFVLNYSNLRRLPSILQEETITRDTVKRYAALFQDVLS